ncbi:MAG: redox-sensing transcriptional repressor Rex [Planctomycetes bacterium]|nr:redox-sensing transcriptional repressor Rex [Planctomycetota bacterium]MBI3834914.1 redox-sensing transcriptional repressor Rex [Planctomycetota bacterium]
MARAENVPAAAVQRLSLYLRQLDFFQAHNRRTISSRQLGDPLGISDAQVRKDLAHFGQFGQAGVGYRVSELGPRLRQILGTDKTAPVVLVGFGNLGRALGAYHGFDKRGFEVAAVFDADPKKVGQSVPGIESARIRPMSDLPKVVAERDVRLGILAVPATAAQAAAETMVAAGIRGILNFAPVTLHVDADVAVASVDLAVQLEQLSFQIAGQA